MYTVWIAISAIATFSAVLVALGIGIYNGVQAKDFEKNRYKSEQLKRIADWAIALHTAPLTVEFPMIDMTRIWALEATKALPVETIAALYKRADDTTTAYIEAQLDLKIGNALALSDFMVEIAKKDFDKKDKKLSDEVKEVTKYAIYSYILDGMSEGQTFEEASEALGGFHVEEARKDLKKMENNIGKLKTEHKIIRNKATKSIYSLLVEIVKNMP